MPLRLQNSKGCFYERSYRDPAGRVSDVRTDRQIQDRLLQHQFPAPDGAERGLAECTHPERSAARQRALSRHLLHLCAAGRAVWRERRNAGAQKGRGAACGAVRRLYRGCTGGRTGVRAGSGLCGGAAPASETGKRRFPRRRGEKREAQSGKRHRGAHQQQAQLCPDAAFAADVRGRGVWRGAAGRA